MSFFDGRAAALALLTLACAAPSALAQTAIPGCYRPLRIAAPAGAPATQLFVLVDQTVQFDANLRRGIDGNALGFLGPGNGVTVLQFSAFNQGRYTDMLLSGDIEPPLPQRQRDATGAMTLDRLDRCLSLQQAFARRAVGTAIDQALSGASASLSRSDIVASLEEISRLVAQSSAHDRVVLLASDMLENSSLASFYKAGGVRRIDPEAELAKVERLGLLGDFRDARVFVIGAGLLPEQGAHSAESSASDRAYRDPLTMKALARFWQGYFEKSHARLAGFGMPMLLTPAH